MPAQAKGAFTGSAQATITACENQNSAATPAQNAAVRRRAITPIISRIGGSANTSSASVYWRSPKNHAA